VEGDAGACTYHAVGTRRTVDECEAGAIGVVGFVLRVAVPVPEADVVAGHYGDLGVYK
jgi:hypothetical protein